MTDRLWFPMINSDECDGCQGTYKCVFFCPHGVLEIKSDKAFTSNPLDCIYGCSACTKLCPKDAIIFPPKQEIVSRSLTKSAKKNTELHKAICEDCGKRFSTNRDTSYCFDCEKRRGNTRQTDKKRK